MIPLEGGYVLAFLVPSKALFIVIYFVYDTYLVLVASGCLELRVASAKMIKYSDSILGTGSASK